MANRIQLRRDHSTNWTRVNPVLSDGEPGLEIDTNKVKYGDGATAWRDLPYASGAGNTFTVTNVSYFTNDTGYLTSSSAVISNLQNSISTVMWEIPTAVSSLTNDIGYLTSATVNQYVNSFSGTNQLVSGAYTVSLDSTGVLSLSSASTILGTGLDPNVYIETSTTATTSTWTFGTDGILTLPNDTPIIKGGGTGTDVTVVAGTGTNNKIWTFGIDGSVTFPDATVQTTAYTGPVPSLPICVINSSDKVSLPNNQVRVNFTVNNPSGSTITAIGIFVPNLETMQAADSNSTGTQDKILVGMDGNQRYAQVYATNGNGTSYSAPFLLVAAGICLLAGTMISLSDGSYKAIEDITYTDKMLSWNFDQGCYAETKAVWIKRSETGSQYNLLTFSDGTTLRTFDQHRIFNKQAGAFTYPMTDATPIGTITVNEHGQEITLVDKQVIVDTIEYYNVITDYHMNLFSDSILTSCRFNNIYPITDMKFVKDGRTLRTRDEFENIPDRFFYGLRLAEQTTDIETVEWYVNRLISFEIESQLVTE